MRIQLLRHATLLITVNNKKLLVDPMLSTAGVMPPIDNSPNSDRNPLVELMAPPNFLQEIDAILLTHTHRDHLDEVAIKQLPKNKPLLCQPEDDEMCPIDTMFHWGQIKLTRTGGQHGTGTIAEKMAPVSGYVLKVKIIEETSKVRCRLLGCLKRSESITAIKQESLDCLILLASRDSFQLSDCIFSNQAKSQT